MEINKKANSEAFLKKFPNSFKSQLSYTNKMKADIPRNKVQTTIKQTTLSKKANKNSVNYGSTSGNITKKSTCSKLTNKVAIPGAVHKRNNSQEKHLKKSNTAGKYPVAKCKNASISVQNAERNHLIKAMSCKESLERIDDLEEDVEENVDKANISVNILKYSGNGKNSPSHHLHSLRNISQSDSKIFSKETESIEDSFKKALTVTSGEKFETAREFFDKIIKEDVKYGPILKEIKSYYEEKINSLLNFNNKNEAKMKRGISGKLDLVKETDLIEDLVEQNLQIEQVEDIENGRKISSDNVGIKEVNQGKQKHSVSFVIPRLDLSKINNKFENEKIVIVQPKTKGKYTIFPKKLSLNETKKNGLLDKSDHFKKQIFGHSKKNC